MNAPTEETPVVPVPAAKRLLCPSARPDWHGAEAIGVVGGTVADPRVRYLSRRLPVVDDLLDMTAPVQATEVIRFAAPCARHACQHFRDARCHLVEKVVAQLPAVVDELPPCAIRETCRWFHQAGADACKRCPQIVTDAPPLDERMLAITDPTL